MASLGLTALTTPGAPPFDPATGEWLRTPAVPGAPSPDAKPGLDAEARRDDRTSRLWDIILWIDLGLLAVAFLGGGALALYRLLTGQDQAVPVVDAATLWLSAVVALLLMGIVPLAWGYGTRVGRWHGMTAYFRLDGFLRSIVPGLGLGILLLAALRGIALALDALGWLPANPQAEAIVETVDWPLAIAVAASAGFGEEVVFRGLLQRRIGMWGQAALFALVHASYGTVLQLLIPGALGLLFGYVVKRGARLWVVILAHFLFNFAQLAQGLVSGA